MGEDVVDLTAITGLPLKLLDNGQLEFGPQVEVAEFSARPVRDLASVALDSAACEAVPGEEVAYYMYNGVSLRADRAQVEGWGMRYELTSIPARTIDREFIKTLGHRHNAALGSGLTYAEVCEVLHGVAHFFFQKRGARPGETDLACYVEVKAREKILMPPDLLHLTINPGLETLVFSDVISLGVYGIYEDFRRTSGAAYLEVQGDGAPGFIPNPNYTYVPALRRLAVQDYPEVGLRRGVPLYRAFLERGAQWHFITHPDRFWSTFPEMKAALGL